MQKNEIDHFVTPIRKINLKYTEDLNARTEIVKLLKETRKKTP